MKKLMIVATIGLAAVCSYGAQFTWGFQAQGITAPGGVEGQDYLMEGTAFLYIGTVTASATAFNFAVADYVTSRSGFDSEYYTYGSTVAPVLHDVAGGGKEVTSTVADQAFTLILIDKAGATVADLAGYEGNYILYTGKSLSPGEIPSMTGGETQYYARFLDGESTYAGQWQTMAAPEPTSGILLLIGVAGLALKRKRA